MHIYLTYLPPPRMERERKNKLFAKGLAPFGFIRCGESFSSHTFTTHTFTTHTFTTHTFTTHTFTTHTFTSHRSPSLSTPHSKPSSSFQPSREPSSESLGSLEPSQDIQVTPSMKDLFTSHVSILPFLMSSFSNAPLL
jgi:hypothetical protein